MKFQSADSSLLIDKSNLNNIKAHIKNQSIQQKRITNEINNKENNNYLNALINEQLQEILLLHQDLHQLTQHKALLSTIMAEQDDSKNSADNQIAMTYFLIDILRTNNLELKDQNLENELSKFGISKEDQLSQKENLNIILKLEQQLKLITDGRVKTQITFKIIFDIFQVIDQYEKVINHNIEFLLKLQIQLDEVEGIEYCDYRGLEQMIKELYQIMQQISSDKTFNIEIVKQPSKILTQLKKQLIDQRHANIKLTKLSLFKSKNNQTQQMLKIQQSSCETIKMLIAGIKKVQEIIHDSQIKKEQNDSSIVEEIIKLLDEETLMNYNEKKVAQIKLMAINFKQYVSSIKEDQKQKSHLNKIFKELQDIYIQLTIISDFKIIPSKNEKYLLLLLSDLKAKLDDYNKQVIESKQTNQLKYKDEHVFFGEIADNSQQLMYAQQENLKILAKNLELRNSINDHYLNIKNLLKDGDNYSTIIQVMIIKIWDLHTGRQIGEDMIHGSPLCFFFQDSSNLYSGEQQGFIVHWNQKQIQHIYNNFRDPITHILSIQNKVYARSSNSIVIRVKFGKEDTVYINYLKQNKFDSKEIIAILKRNIIEQEQEQEQEQEILITVDDEEITLRNIKDVMIDSAENDNTTRFIKLNSKNKLKALAVQSGNNEILYGGTQQGTIQIWDTKKVQMIDEISLSKQPITRLIYLERSNQLISSSEDGNVYFLQNNQIQEKLLQSEKLIKYMEVSEDERFIILAHQSNLTLWDIQEDKPNMIDSFGEFKDISALLVNFSHLYALIGDSNKLHKIPLSLRRILKNYAEELNYYPTCISYRSISTFIKYEFITGDHLGRIGFWGW